MRVYSELGGMTGALYRCLECNYIGPVIIERELSDDEIQALEEQWEADESTRSEEADDAPQKRRTFKRSRP
jgi:hypothetical protein